MAALGFAVPATARAQAVTPADMIGVWEGVPGLDSKSPKDTTGKAAMTHALVVRADSTWTEVAMKGSQMSCGGGRWRVAGDTAFWQMQGQTFPHKVVLKDRQLLLYDWKNQTKPAEAYKRADTTVTPKPRPLASMSQCASALRSAGSAMGRRPAAGARRGAANARATPATPAAPAAPAAGDKKDKAKKPETTNPPGVRALLNR